MSKGDTAVSFEKIGHMQPRHARQIAASPWAIGGETIDRGYSVFENWREYLGPLGAKMIRLQAGWARCEKECGSYDFEWLDTVVDGVIEQGVAPWLQTSYGNPLYGGEAKLGAGIPRSPEVLTAWERWVRALAMRYRDRVFVWEVWNEPDLLHHNVSPEEYALLYVRTAEAIRDVQPEARLFAGSLAFPGKTEYVAAFLRFLDERHALDLVDEITFHGYFFHPTQAYWAPYRLNEKEIIFSAEKLRRTVNAFSSRIRIRQGEQGAPSEPGSGALGNWDWTELKQAKWLLRRMLTDWGHDVPASYFGIIDMNYGVGKGDLFNTMNTKGLLKANDDCTVASVKPSYYAFQHLAALIDHGFERIPNYHYTADVRESLSVYAFRLKGADQQTVVFWLDGQWPTDNLERTPVRFSFNSGRFTCPVYIDLRTGDVFEIPREKWTSNGTEYVFNDIPVYDSPVAIAERYLVDLKD